MMMAIPVVSGVSGEIAGIIVSILLLFGISRTIEEVKVAEPKKDEEKVEVHKPWAKQEKYQGSIRRGNSMLIGKQSGHCYKKDYKEYLYEMDKLHDDEMEIYTQKGSKGIHCGACSAKIGGPITKAAKPGRTINV
jgi:hypothetical protein